MIQNFIHIQYCFDYLINQIPVVLLLYSHIPTALVALIFGIFVAYKKRGPASFSLLMVGLFFALWCFFDLSSWFAFLGSYITMFTWSLLDLFALLFFFFSYYFLYSFISERDLPNWQKIAGAILLLPTVIWTFLGLNLLAFDANVCEAWEHEQIALYPYFVQAIFLIAVIVFAITQYRKAKDRVQRKEILFSTLGVSLFLGFFFLATLGVNFLVNYSIIDFAYNFEIYGLFGMPILLVYLGFLIVKYKAFDLRVFSVQALAIATIAIVAAQYAFLEGTAPIILNSINLVLVGLVSLYLVKNVRREISLREQLEVMNKQQVETMRFITHEVKGYLTDSSGAFDALLTNTFGEINAETREMVTEALAKDQKAINEIKEFLRISDFKTGKVAYKIEPFDLKKSLTDALPSLEENAKKKGLELKSEIGDGTFMIKGDIDQITNHVIGNLINNATNYTPHGSITVRLSHSGNRIVFAVKDSGIGLSDDDKKVLFTEGGRGAESRDVNPHSTGYGLFIAKKIIDAHNSRIWAESEGRGKGSTFFVEFPSIS